MYLSFNLCDCSDGGYIGDSRDISDSSDSSDCSDSNDQKTVFTKKLALQKYFFSFTFHIFHIFVTPKEL